LNYKENKIEHSYNEWKIKNIEMFCELKKNEESINDIFIGIYNLEDVMTPNVEEQAISVTKIVDIKSEDDKKNSYIINKESVIKSLHQTGREGEAKDGMDISFVAFNKEKLTLEFSGANNPLYIVRDNNKKAIQSDKQVSNDTHTLYEIKGDKMPIGIYGAKVNNFKTIDIKLEKGDAIYLFSDGYPDQFGGAKGKKFKYKPYKQIILDNVTKPMEEQKEILDTAFYNWKADHEQVDDIIVIGIRF
jgi:hypothetical protein